MAAAAGLRLSCNGDGLRVTGPKPERERLRPMLAEHKGEILALLAGPLRVEESVQANPVAPATCEELDPHFGLPRDRIESAALRLGLPVADVLARFDSWRYTDADHADMAGWSDAVFKAHAWLLANESALAVKTTSQSDGVSVDIALVRASAFATGTAYE